MIKHVCSLFVVFLGAAFTLPAAAQESPAEPQAIQSVEPTPGEAPVIVARPPPTAAALIEAEVSTYGEVTQFDSGEVHIRFNGLPEFYPETRVAFVTGDTRVVGTVRSRTGNTLVVRVGFGENVPVGTRAELTTTERTGVSTLERRMTFRLTTTVRGLFNLKETTFFGGIISDIDAEWRLHAPVFLRLIMDPVGVGVGSRTTVGFGGAHIVGGYDSSFFAIGLGIGAQMIDANKSNERSGHDTGVGTSLGGLIRFGSPDGFLLEIFNSWTYYNQFHFGSLRVRAQWPVGLRNWMVMRGVVGLIRANHLEFGFRRLLSGWSGEGALFLTVSAGGALVFVEPPTRGNFSAGPTLGVSIEKLW